ncbi:MAG TPA: hypothetical protein VD962_03690 [Rubricoccaceae bacterium]|nr:hypothetical protein [Rubricoccaceae bacterium]
MPERALPLRVVDGFTLPEAIRAALRPDEVVKDDDGREVRLPRYFYEVPSWARAQEVLLAPHFGLWEFVNTDVREAEALRGWPRYVPCAVTLLAAHLEVLRDKVGAFLRVAANGGYRSPAHALDAGRVSPHHWGTAANIVRTGDAWMDDEKAIETVREAARDVLPGVWTRPFGEAPGTTFDHLHLDLGYVVLVPPGADDAPTDTDGDA